MAEDLMRYDILAQHALRGVVRLALRRVERDGLPGEHHFFISFDTQHQGVRLSEKLLARHPAEMTIVLQHQFWNLRVLEDRFEVELSFDNVPEHMVIPYAAIKGFFDPTVQFGLQFETEFAPTSGEEKDETGSNQPTELTAANADNVSTKPPAALTDTLTGSSPADEQEMAKPSDEDDPNKVVSLDAFRKK